MCKMVWSFFNHGHMLKEINKGYITLIPKIDKPISVNPYRLVVV